MQAKSALHTRVILRDIVLDYNTYFELHYGLCKIKLYVIFMCNIT
jgi:hypothetical protein